MTWPNADDLAKMIAPDISNDALGVKANRAAERVLDLFRIRAGAAPPNSLDSATLEAAAKFIEQTYRGGDEESLRATFVVPEAKSGILQAWHTAGDIAAAIRTLAGTGVPYSKIVTALKALADRALEYVGEQPNPNTEQVLDCDAEMRKLALEARALVAEVTGK